MIKVKIGSAFKNFTITDFFEMPKGKVQANWTAETATVSLDADNYMKIKGTFEGTGEAASVGEFLAAADKITGITKVIDGEKFVVVSGLSIGTKELASIDSYQKYLETSSYKIEGNGESNKIFGGSAKDLIDGGKGNDKLYGNKGNDQLTGGLGKDDFIYHKRDGKDVITDFAAAGKQADTIDLSDYGKDLSFKNDIDISKHGKDVLVEIGRGEEILLQDILKHFEIKDISAADFDF